MNNKDRRSDLFQHLSVIKTINHKPTKKPSCYRNCSCLQGLEGTHEHQEARLSQTCYPTCWGTTQRPTLQVNVRFRYTQVSVDVVVDREGIDEQTITRLVFIINAIPSVLHRDYTETQTFSEHLQKPKSDPKVLSITMKVQKHLAFLINLFVAWEVQTRYALISTWNVDQMAK